MNDERVDLGMRILKRLPLIWMGFMLGVILGVAGTCLYFQDIIRENGQYRELAFRLYWTLIMMFLFLPPIVFEGIRRYIEYRRGR